MRVFVRTAVAAGHLDAASRLPLGVELMPKSVRVRGVRHAYVRQLPSGLLQRLLDPSNLLSPLA